jgi:hypothetical protein
VFARFRQLGSARQVLISLAAEQMHFPRPSDSKTLVSVDWTAIRYLNVISILKNPFYAGAYAYWALRQIVRKYPPLPAPGAQSPLAPALAPLQRQ